MADTAPNAPKLSVQILLTEAIDRRLARWTKNAPGASWPTWGGHITLIPAFVPNRGVAEIQNVIEDICSHAKPFLARLAEPIAVQDKTRADYFALFLTVESSHGAGELWTSSGIQPIHELHQRLEAGLGHLRQDLHPAIVGQPFLPHITLALGLGESEARSLVRELRMQPLAAQFEVDTIWLVKLGDGETARVERYPVALGPQSAIDPVRY